MVSQKSGGVLASEIRAVSELVVHGAFQMLDLSPFSYERIPRNESFLEEAVI
ncbi:hypothetical protein [Mesorhizobium sp. B263B2A]|uniref:hypothetical protein n=1 Tax=Mesorhizobium sp. B263B2A TaxID=2876669 RepID=UPI001CD10A23|nr:hypothetical protein [Mesorhizobium sp. B263B2A]MCA0034805.1 hypothetical protein [Mesorhizobium sp. B263B2A]